MDKTHREAIEKGLSEDFSRPVTTLRQEQLKRKFLAPGERKKPQEVDPWEMERENYKVNISQLLKIDPSVFDKRQNSTATKFLLWDNYFEAALVDGLTVLEEEGIKQELLNGQHQILYFWLYRHSYGYGYRACAMGQKQLAKKLHWSINKVKRYLRELEQKEIIKPIFAPFNNRRPTVYEVMFPRQILEGKLALIKEERRDEAAQKALGEIKALLRPKVGGIQN